MRHWLTDAVRRDKRLHKGPIGVKVTEFKGKPRRIPSVSKQTLFGPAKPGACARVGKELVFGTGPLTALLVALESKDAVDFKHEWFEDRLYPILHLKYFGELLETDPGGGIWKRHVGCKGRRVSSARLHRVAMAILKVLARDGLK